MAIYNLSYGKLESLIDRSFSPGTENAIIDAIKSAGIVAPSSGKIGVEVEKTSGSYAVPHSAQIFLDTGSGNTITINDDGAKLIAAGDASNHIIDDGPGGDTLVGGAGAESLKVTHGENELIAGSGANTLVGGAGNDTLIGGGADTINLNYGNEFVQGGSGSDQVHLGLHGNDIIYGGNATTVHTDQTSS